MTVLLTIPCKGERNMNFMVLLTMGGIVGVSDILASFFDVGVTDHRFVGI
jgi:hypothetical protein